MREARAHQQATVQTKRDQQLALKRERQQQQTQDREISSSSSSAQLHGACAGKRAAASGIPLPLIRLSSWASSSLNFGPVFRPPDGGTASRRAPRPGGGAAGAWDVQSGASEGQRQRARESKPAHTGVHELSRQQRKGMPTARAEAQVQRGSRASSSTLMLSKIWAVHAGGGTSSRGRGLPAGTRAVGGSGRLRRTWAGAGGGLGRWYWSAPRRWQEVGLWQKL